VIDMQLRALEAIRRELVRMNERIDVGFDAVGTLGVLVDGMRADLSEVRDDFGGVRGDLAGLRVHVETLERETIRGFTAVKRAQDRTNGALDRANQRLDHLVGSSGARRREHDDRLRALEGRADDE
jgi:hypothetical protein